MSSSPHHPERNGRSCSETVLLPDPERVRDVEIKQERAGRFIRASGADAILLQRPENVACITAGGDVSRAGSSETTAAVLLTPDARLIISNNVDAPLLFERELFGLGFQLKQRAWHQPASVLLSDVVRGRKVISDSGFPGTQAVNGQISQLRGPLTSLDCERMRKLGRVVVHAVEATAMSFEHGQTEAEVAAQVAHRLIKRTVQPERIQICADGRLARFRHWTYSSDVIKNSAVISCVARRWGLCVGVTRTVSFDKPDRELRAAHQKTVLMHATGMYFSRNGVNLQDLWKKVHRIYEKFDMPHEWRHADQSEVIGYGLREANLVTDQGTSIVAPIGMFWHPSVGPAMTGDTVLVGKKRSELLTPLRNWPQLTVTVRGMTVNVPDILSRSELPTDTESNHTVSLPSRHLALSDPDLGTMDSAWEFNIAEAGSTER